MQLRINETDAALYLDGVKQGNLFVCFSLGTAAKKNYDGSYTYFEQNSIRGCKWILKIPEGEHIIEVKKIRQKDGRNKGIRIRKNARNGLGIVYVQRDACGGCFNKIPPQRQLDVKMHKKVIVCEYCGRIIVDPELAGVKNDKSAAAEKPKRKRAIRKTKEETE